MNSLCGEAEEEEEAAAAAAAVAAVIASWNRWTRVVVFAAVSSVVVKMSESGCMQERVNHDRHYSGQYMGTAPTSTTICCLRTDCAGMPRNLPGVFIISAISLNKARQYSVCERSEIAYKTLRSNMLAICSLSHSMSLRTA